MTDEERLRYSRIERFIYYLSDGGINRETALKVYCRLDFLPDKVLEMVDKEIYDDLDANNII